MPNLAQRHSRHGALLTYRYVMVISAYTQCLPLGFITDKATGKLNQLASADFHSGNTRIFDHKYKSFYLYTAPSGKAQNKGCS